MCKKKAIILHPLISLRSIFVLLLSLLIPLHAWCVVQNLRFFKGADLGLRISLVPSTWETPTGEVIWMRTGDDPGPTGVLEDYIGISAFCKDKLNTIPVLSTTNPAGIQNLYSPVQTQCNILDPNGNKPDCYAANDAVAQLAAQGISISCGPVVAANKIINLPKLQVIEKTCSIGGGRNFYEPNQVNCTLEVTVTDATQPGTLTCKSPNANPNLNMTSPFPPATASAMVLGSTSTPIPQSPIDIIVTNPDAMTTSANPPPCLDFTTKSLTIQCNWESTGSPQEVAISDPISITNIICT